MISELAKAAAEQAANAARDVGTVAKDGGKSWEGELPKAEMQPASQWEGELPSKETASNNWDGALPGPENASSERMDSPLANEKAAMGVPDSVNIEKVPPADNEMSPLSREGMVYSDAGVDLKNSTTENLQGKDYTVYKLDVDPALEGPDGRTNAERMSNGEAPYVDVDGKLEKVTLHHHEQKNDVLVELDQKNHQSNNDALHPNRGAGEGRGEDPLWNARRNEHWQNRGLEA